MTPFSSLINSNNQYSYFMVNFQLVDNLDDSHLELQTGIFVGEINFYTILVFLFFRMFDHLYIAIQSILTDDPDSQLIGFKLLHIFDSQLIFIGWNIDSMAGFIIRLMMAGFFIILQYFVFISCKTQCSHQLIILISNGHLHLEIDCNNIQC